MNAFLLSLHPIQVLALLAGCFGVFGFFWFRRKVFIPAATDRAAEETATGVRAKKRWFETPNPGDWAILISNPVIAVVGFGYFAVSLFK